MLKPKQNQNIIRYAAAFWTVLAVCAAAQTLESPADSVAEVRLFPNQLPYCEVLGQVVCESEFPLDDVESLKVEIGALQTDLMDYLGIPKPDEPIGLCLFRGAATYSAFLKRTYPNAPSDRPALYIKDNGPGRLFLYCDDRLILNLRHEMTHAFLNAALRNVPIWLDEGLAKYFETPAGERGFKNPFLEPVAQRADDLFRPTPSLAGLERLTRIDQMGVSQYRDSWAWIHFLIHYSSETHKLLGLYLCTLRPENQRDITSRRAAEIQKTAPLSAFLKREMPDYKKRYKEHFETWGRSRPSEP